MKAIRRKIKAWLKAWLKRDRYLPDDFNLEKWAALEYSKQLPRNRQNINYKHLIERK